MRKRSRLCAFVVALTLGAFGITTGTASGVTFNVACGDVTGLRGAITAANGTAAADVIEIATGSPCTFTLINASVTDAGSGSTGLPIVTQPLTINGHGATIQRSTTGGTPQFRLFFTAFARLELNDLTISSGSLNGANHAGAGILSFGGNLVANGAIVASNGTFGSGGAGGGIATIGGELHLHRSTLAFNIATNGAGINTNQTVTEVRRSTIGLNLAVNTGGMLVQGSTGTFENVTFAANQATNNNLGGLGVANSGAVPATVSVASSTFADNGRNGNTAPGGALFALANGANATINVTDTIVTDTDSVAAPTLAPCAALSLSGTATINDNGGNLEWPGTTCGFDTNADPELAALADNGGGSVTYRLEPNSPAIDLGGNDCPATDQRGEARPDGDACDTGSFETNPPETTADGPDGPTNDPEITFTSDEVGSTFLCSVDSADPVDCESPFDPGVTGDGEHTVTVQAIDTEGYFDPSPASVTFVLDTTDPVVEITSSPSSPTIDNTATIEFTVTDESDTTSTCQVDDGDAESCSSPFTTDALDDGEHTITVTAIDEAGNDGSDSVTFVVDATPPVVEITSGPGAVTSDNTPAVEFTVDDGDAAVTCQVDDEAAQSCLSPFTTEALDDGEHTITVTATDEAGNEGSDSVTFVVDTVPPLVEITSSPTSPTGDNTPAIEFTVDDEDAAVTCQVDDDDPQSCSSPFTADALDDGEHTITVTATDEAGNEGSDSVTFVVDASAPDTTITSGPTGTTTSASATFTFISSENDSTFECRVDGGAWSTCSSPHQVTVAPGTHTFEVRAVDPLNNADPTPASRTWAYQNCTFVRVAFSLFGIPIVLCL